MHSEDDLPAICGDARLPLLPESFARLTGRPLIGTILDVARALWTAPRVILAHGTEADPLFFYANRLALTLFALPPERFIGMPSRLSAEAPQRDERLRLLDRVTRSGFIDDYAGVRISATGHRFRIEQATVWNLIDGDGKIHGQAATFARWTPLD